MYRIDFMNAQRGETRVEPLGKIIAPPDRLSV
jgi:hypothetical protein